MLEKHLITHCAPTLALLKTANLFSYPCTDHDSLKQWIAYWNRQMEPKGISITVLQARPSQALIYVYRKSSLEADLNSPGVASFLKARGYETMEIPALLNHLRRRLESEGGFPHEIGLFLGYPLGDVTGFIDNGGKNYLSRGCWKVYTNEQETLRMFAAYKKCSSIYETLWRKGKSVWQLTVSA